jgi:hypothetical protein
MSLIDSLGIASFSLISISFYFVRSRLLLFGVIWVLIIGLSAVFALRHASPAYPAEGAVLIAGLFLYGLGLLVVRVMLRRSVSLRLLGGYLPGQAAGDIREEISARLIDARLYHLVTLDRDVYRLTGFGKVVAAVMRILYRVTKS